jgi:hypothetical protein
MISRCSSPMPEMIVSLVSSSKPTTKVGSSSARVQRLAIFSLSPGSRADADRHHRRRELDRFEHDRVVLGSQSVSPVRVSPAHHGDDVAARRPPRCGSWRLACMRSRRPMRCSCRACCCRPSARLERAGVDADVGQLAHVLVGHDLERQRGERRVVRPARAASPRLLRADDRAGCRRRGQEVHDAVEQPLDALVLEGGAAVDGHHARAMVALRMMARISSSDRSPVSRNFSSSASSCSAHFSTRLARHLRAFSSLSAGISSSWKVWPLSFSS